MLVCAGGGILCWVLDQRRYFFLFCAKKMSLPASQPGTNGGRRLLSLPSSPLRFRSQGALCCPSLSPPHEPAPAPTSVPAAGAPLVERNAAAFAGNKGCGMFLRPAENPASRGGAAAFGGPGALGPLRLWLSKKWLAPLFRGVHSSLAPTARPGSYARKPLLRKAFCGFDAHVAKSDQSLRGLRPPNPRGFFDSLRLGNAQPFVCGNGGCGAVRNGPAATLRGVPCVPLRTGLPPPSAAGSAAPAPDA